MFLKQNVSFDKIGSENTAEAVEYLDNFGLQCLDFFMYHFEIFSIWNHVSLSNMNHVIPKLAQTSLIYEITFWHWRLFNPVSSNSLPSPHSITWWVLSFAIMYYSKYMKTRHGKEILNFNKLRTKLYCWLHRHLDMLPYSSHTLSLSLCSRHIWERGLCNSEIFGLLHFCPLHFHQNNVFFTEDFTSKMFTKTKREKSGAMYIFSVEKLKP